MKLTKKKESVYAEVLLYFDNLKNPDILTNEIWVISIYICMLYVNGMYG